jgi:heme/copper-type cytochrome/quinol oxidase subunit 4
MKNMIIFIGRIVQIAFHPLVGSKEVLDENQNESNYNVGLFTIIIILIIVFVIILRLFKTIMA